MILQNCAYFKWEKFSVSNNGNLPDFVKMTLNGNDVGAIIKMDFI